LSTPRKQDADFEVSAVKALDRRDINGRVMTSVAAFAESAVLRFRKAAGDAAFKFLSDLVDLEFQFSIRFCQLLAPQMYLIISRFPIVNGS
jgi:hypothetical protein